MEIRKENAEQAKRYLEFHTPGNLGPGTPEGGCTILIGPFNSRHEMESYITKFKAALSGYPRSSEATFDEKGIREIRDIKNVFSPESQLAFLSRTQEELE